MKKVPFYLIIFLLTTGFFKSTLEKCADYHFEMSNYLPRAEYKSIKIPDSEYLKMYQNWLAEKEVWAKKNNKLIERVKKMPICKSWSMDPKRKCRNAFDTRLMRSFEEAPKKSKIVKVRDYSEKEIKRNLDKFLRQSLKVKLRLADQGKTGGQGYLNVYKDCVRFKEKNFQLFKDKYN